MFSLKKPNENPKSTLKLIGNKPVSESHLQKTTIKFNNTPLFIQPKTLNKTNFQAKILYSRIKHFDSNTTDSFASKWTSQPTSSTSKDKTSNSEITADHMFGVALDNKEVEFNNTHFIGSVEYGINWYHKLKSKAEVLIIYQIAGWLDCIKDGKSWCEKVLFLRGDSGSVIQGVFYEIDRKVPPLSKGQFLSCVGSMTGSHKLRVYDIQELSNQERIALQRITFICHTAINRLCEI